MNKLQISIWIAGLSLIILCSFFLHIYIPDLFSGLGVEIAGTLIGFLLAILFADAIKDYEKRNRGKALLANLNSEVEIFLHKFAKEKEKDQTPSLISMDIWNMAISSGELSLITPALRNTLSVFYNDVRESNLHYHVLQQAEFGTENRSKLKKICMIYYEIAEKRAHIVLSKMKH